MTLTTDKYPCPRWDSNPRSQQASGPAARLLRSWVRIPPGTWIFVCCECRVLSGRGLCVELITRPEESYRLCCVVVCDLETSRIGAPYIYNISRLRVKQNNSYCTGSTKQIVFMFISWLLLSRHLRRYNAVYCISFVRSSGC